MASIANRSRFRVGVKHRDDLTQHFPFHQHPAVEAYASALREQGYEPEVKQLDESWRVRVRHQGTAQSTTGHRRCAPHLARLQAGLSSCIDEALQRRGAS
jgi:hypothetical protein